jgi:hypothetical protein
MAAIISINIVMWRGGGGINAYQPTKANVAISLMTSASGNVAAAIIIM